MIAFIRKYSLLFQVAFPLWVGLGLVFRPANLILVAVYTFYFYVRDRHDYIIMAFLIILLLGDSRQPIFLFAKPLRMEMMVIITLLSLNDIRKGKYNINYLFLFFLPFFFLALTSLGNSPDFTTGLLKTISYLLLIFNGFHYVQHQVVTYGKSLLNDIVMLVALLLLAGVLLIPIFPDFCFYLGSLRYNGVLGNPNGMGILVTLVFPIFVYYFETNKNISANFKALCYFLLMFSLLLCSSRNAMISVTIFIGLYYGFKGSWGRRIFVFVGLMPVVIMLIYTVDLEQLIINFGLDSYFRIKDFESGSGRIYAWEYALEIAQDNPIMGCGFYCEEFKFRYEPSFFLVSTGHQGGVHNSYLAFLVNVGGLGLLAFVGAWVGLLTRVKKSKFIIPFAASVIFSAVFESWLVASLNAFNIFLILMVVFLLSDQKFKLFRLE